MTTLNPVPAKYIVGSITLEFRKSEQHPVSIEFGKTNYFLTAEEAEQIASHITNHIGLLRYTRERKELAND